MLLSLHPINMTFMCSLTYCYLQSCMDNKFCSYKPRRSSEAWQSWEKILQLTNLIETTSQQIGVEKLYIMTNLKRSTNFSHRSYWCGQKVS